MSQPRILMCAPDYFDILYEINPWMHKEIKVGHETATLQWNQLKKTIEHCGAQVELVDCVEGWPDMVFTANAALLYGNKCFLANFKYAERQGERAYFKTWFDQHDYEIVNPEITFDFEGAGDALFAGKILFAAHGFRSEARIYDEIKAMGDFTVLHCKLVDAYFYHIDTCFCPLNDQHAIWWPGAFDEDSQKRMKATGVELHAVPEADAKHFACNAVVIDEQVIIPSNCPGTRKILEDLGFTVHDVPMTEYLKSGGACKCLTLRL